MDGFKINERLIKWQKKEDKKDLDLTIQAMVFILFFVLIVFLVGVILKLK